MIDKNKVVKILNKNLLVLFPCDTIYGILGRAESADVIEKIYQIKGRSKKKAMIILISSLDDLKEFNIVLNNKQKFFLKKAWPGPISVIFSCDGEEFKYLHRGNYSLAFRLPHDKNLIEIIEKTGPLVAPSANLENERPFETAKEAKKCFGDKIDLYVSGKVLKGKSSTLVDFTTCKIKFLRKGKGYWSCLFWSKML